MVAAVHFYGTPDDQLRLLDHLGEPHEVSLHPWPLVGPRVSSMTREEALAASQVMVQSTALGPPRPVRPGDSAYSEPTRAGLFNRLSWDALGPSQDEGLVDSNASPVLLWVPAALDGTRLVSGHIGSQADSMSAVSSEYERWVKRVMAWVRRTGTVVWGLETTAIRPDLHIERSDVSTVYALPGALSVLEAGGIGAEQA